MKDQYCIRLGQAALHELAPKRGCIGEEARAKRPVNLLWIQAISRLFQNELFNSGLG